MQSSKGQRLADIAKAIPPTCYKNPTWRGIAVFARDVAIYTLGLAFLASTDSLALIVLGWLFTGNAISALFVIGHDAAHGALFKSKNLNYLIGQTAMLPSLHAYSVWAYGHNRIHHAFACCRHLDFVWHPVSANEYASYSPIQKARHRIEWSALGSGLYYARAMWLGRIILGSHPKKLKTAFVRDRGIVLAFAITFTTVCLVAGWNQYGTVSGGLWFFTKLFLLPWLLWNWAIGWAVYIQHIHPGVEWCTRRDWTKVTGHVRGATDFSMPWWVNTSWHNIFDHTAHHLDPRIPFYHLPAATAALQKEHGNLVQPMRYDLREYIKTTQSCKLYNFEKRHWTDYNGVPARAAATP